MKTKRLVLLIDPEDYAALGREAMRRGLSLGALVRRTLRGAIKRGNAV